LLSLFRGKRLFAFSFFLGAIIGDHNKNIAKFGFLGVANALLRAQGGEEAGGGGGGGGGGELKEPKELLLLPRPLTEVEDVLSLDHPRRA